MHCNLNVYNKIKFFNLFDPEYNAFLLKGAPRDAEEELHETQLTHVKKCVIEKKDFSSEIRGRRDIDGFVAKSEVLLDIHETQLEAVVDKLLDSMFSNSKQHKISSVSGIG